MVLQGHNLCNQNEERAKKQESQPELTSYCQALCKSTTK